MGSRWGLPTVGRSATVMATVQDGQDQEHGRACRGYRSDALDPKVSLGGVGGLDDLGLHRLFLSSHDLSGLTPHRQLIDGVGQMGACHGDVCLDRVR